MHRVWIDPTLTGQLGVDPQQVLLVRHAPVTVQIGRERRRAPQLDEIAVRAEHVVGRGGRLTAQPCEYRCVVLENPGTRGNNRGLHVHVVLVLGCNLPIEQLRVLVGLAQEGQAVLI